MSSINLKIIVIAFVVFVLDGWIDSAISHRHREEILLEIKREMIKIHRHEMRMFHKPNVGIHKRECKPKAAI